MTVVFPIQHLPFTLHNLTNQKKMVSWCISWYIYHRNALQKKKKKNSSQQNQIFIWSNWLDIFTKSERFNIGIKFYEAISVILAILRYFYHPRWQKCVNISKVCGFRPYTTLNSTPQKSTKYVCILQFELMCKQNPQTRNLNTLKCPGGINQNFPREKSTDFCPKQLPLHFYQVWEKN